MLTTAAPFTPGVGAMTKISRSVFLEKRVYPAFWLSLVAMACAALVVEGAPLWVLIAPAAFISLAAAVTWHRVWRLADAVFDCGDALRVRRGRVELTLPLQQIAEVRLSTHAQLTRITLRLTQPCALGDTLSFAPVKPRGLGFFAPNPMAAALAARVAAARCGA